MKKAAIMARPTPPGYGPVLPAEGFFALSFARIIRCSEVFLALDTLFFDHRRGLFVLQIQEMLP